MEKVFDLLNEEDLTTDLKILNDVLGLDVVKELLSKLSGLSFYVPKITHMKTVVIRYVKENRDKPLKKVAFELGISEPHLKTLMKKYK